MADEVINCPAQWANKMFQDFADMLFNELMDGNPMDGRVYEDPIEPWRTWAIAGCSKDAVGKHIALKIERDCKTVFATLDATQQREGHWGVEFSVKHYDE